MEHGAPKDEEIDTNLIIHLIKYLIDSPIEGIWCYLFIDDFLRSYTCFFARLR